MNEVKKILSLLRYKFMYLNEGGVTIANISRKTCSDITDEMRM